MSEEKTLHGKQVNATKGQRGALANPQTPQAACELLDEKLEDVSGGAGINAGNQNTVLNEVTEFRLGTCGAIGVLQGVTPDFFAHYISVQLACPYANPGVSNCYHCQHFVSSKRAAEDN